MEQLSFEGELLTLYFEGWILVRLLRELLVEHKALQELLAVRDGELAKAYEAYRKRGVAARCVIEELKIKLADVQADADYWRVQCMEVAGGRDRDVLELEDQLVDARMIIEELEGKEVKS